MKKVRKILLVLVLIIGIAACGIRSLMKKQISQMYEHLDAVAIVSLEDVADGTYEGTAETPLVKVTVAVTVENHTLKDIQLLRHENGKGTPAEAMLPEMLRQNTSEVDAVSGATMSSKAIRAAVRDALAKGEDNAAQMEFTTAPEQEQSEHAIIAPMPDPLAGAMEGNIPDGVYHVTADGNADYSADTDGQYMVLKFWSYETFEKGAVNQMKVGDVLLLRGEPRRIDALKRSENSLGETTYVDINGGMAEDGITLVFDYEENCFREGAENDAYVLYSVGARKVKLAADFLYADYSSVANPGDPEPEWARGDASAFPDYIAGRELYGNNSYAQIYGGELAALNIEWVP